MLEKITQKLVAKVCNQIKKEDMDVNYKKEAALLLKTVGNILFRLANLDYDTSKDAEVVTETRNSLFNSLYSILSEKYGLEEVKEENIEETKDDSHVIKIDTKNRDIRSVKKEILDFHQLIVETLAFSSTPEHLQKQFKLYQHMYFSVSREIRLGVLNNLETVFSVI